MNDKFRASIAIASVCLVSSTIAYTQFDQGSPIYQQNCVDFVLGNDEDVLYAKAEFPITYEGYAHGMKFRKELRDDEYMIFSTNGGLASFWMQDTPHSLDIAFFDTENMLVHLAEATTPLSEKPITPHEPVGINFVLEVPAGKAREIGLQVGATQIYVAPPTSCTHPQ